MMKQLNTEKISWKLTLNQMVICPRVRHLVFLICKNASVLERNGKYYPQFF